MIAIDGRHAWEADAPQIAMDAMIMKGRALDHHWKLFGIHNDVHTTSMDDSVEILLIELLIFVLFDGSTHVLERGGGMKPMNPMILCRKGGPLRVRNT